MKAMKKKAMMRNNSPAGTWLCALVFGWLLAGDVLWI
jgi:hypothetical protein